MYTRRPAVGSNTVASNGARFLPWAGLQMAAKLSGQETIS